MFLSSIHLFINVGERYSKEFIPLDIINDEFNSNLCRVLPGSQSIIPHSDF
jgi:hypothetical protein